MNTNSKQTGVYIIRCTVNNFVYIGSAASKKGFRGRLIYHLWQLKTGKHHSPILQNHFNKYGIEAFTFEIALVCPPEKCIDFEQVFINAIGLGTQNKSYNINPSVRSYLGRKIKGESKLRGRKASAETRRKISEAHKGKVVSEETRKKLSQSLKGRKMPPESVARRAEKQRGQKRSLEFCENVRRRNLENPLSLEARRKIAQTATDANSKNYVVTSPSGEEIPVNNLSAFCRQHGLTVTQMSECARGLAIAHKGWKCRYAHVTKEEQEIAIATLKLKFGIKEYIVMSPDGEEFRTEHLYTFSLERGLNFSRMYQISQGVVRHYKNWKCRLVNEPEEICIKRLALRGKGKDFIVTTPQGEEISITSLTKFCSEHELDPSGLNKVARGKRSHYKGYLCRYV
ncbi:NUMOD3 domain-containing DNA-binding protein [Nostoc sp.]|uniref:NUMOD3 domain-containing DNA-binding protein n=1 Tax=Nostoc sp. TaxID=1180 RepID=UPI002FEEA81F